MSLYRRIMNLFSRSQLQREIDAELQAHLEMRMDEYTAAGMSPEQARREARLQFGNPAAIQEQVVSADAALLLEGIGRDIHYAARQLRRSPGFTAMATLTLALVIAANVATFGVLNSVILKPLQLSEPARFFTIAQKQQGFDNQSWPDYLDYRRLNTTFSDVAAYRIGFASLSTGTTAYKCWHYEVSGNYFDMLGVQPALGRFFHESDEHGPNSAPYVVLSDAFWRSHFHADSGIIGTTVYLNKHPFVVTGVAPKAFHGTELFLWPDIWFPMVNEQQVEGFDFLSNRRNHVVWALGKLKPDVTAQQATDNLNAIARQLAKQYPSSDNLEARLVRPGLLGDILSGATRAFLLGAMTLAGLVLLATCANLASIFGARAADRGRELAIRLAIGSNRWHIFRQVLTQSLLLAFLGGAAGMVCAAILLEVLSRWQPFADLPIRFTVVPDVRVYGIALLLTIASGIVPGLLPLPQIWRMDPLQILKNGTGTTLFRRLSLRDLLLGVQIALCALLLTASFVALRGMHRSLRAPLGFQPRNAVLAETDVRMAGYSERTEVRLKQRMLEEASHLPGVIAAGIIDNTPLNSGGSSAPVYRQGTADFRASQSAFGAKFFDISPGYLAAAGTRLLSGRDFSWHDDANSPKAALVNETFAHKMFGDKPAVGLRFRLADRVLYQITGIVEDGKYTSLTEEATPAMFFPLTQSPSGDTALVVRSSLPPPEMAMALNRMLIKIDPALPFTIHNWPDALALVLFPARAATVSLGVMGFLAAILAVTGIFGTAAYSVSKRKKEFGIRIALGTRPLQLLQTALSRTVILLLVGSTIGLLFGLGATRLLAQIVYQATPQDPLVLTGVLAAMALVGLLATWIPAKRALASDPATLLKDEA